MPGNGKLSDREDALTSAERRAIRVAGELFSLIRDEICGDGPTRDADLAELTADIHRMQHLVMAQAAARVYPGEFRLMGEVIGGDPKTTAAKSPAVQLLEEALFLRTNGEYAPGGNENWHAWDDKTERFLRGLLPPEAEEDAP